MPKYALRNPPSLLMADKATISAPSTPVETAPARPNRNALSRGRIAAILGMLTVIGIVAGMAYWFAQQKYIYTDKASVTAPLIKLAPHAPGELKKVYVEQGDTIAANRAVARVGDEMLMSVVRGTVIDVKKDLGAIYTPGSAVVTMVDPRELRVMAQIEEDKGLKDIHEGQRVLFTIDAFGSRQYEGIVEAVSQTNRLGDVVFNISDKREEQEFDVKISYDRNEYPELQNGMSARVWIIR